ncbi:hypothetical protein SK128_025561 [Halocaridina rubra]|uniref:Uncharacterized protein n=1 Tax=Halocaridina rubra TaxID=373956 RepID=A0AAN9A2J8_HALRR
MGGVGKWRCKQVIRIRKDRRKKRVPESGGRWEEAIAPPTDPRATNLYTVPVRRARLVSVTWPWQWGRDATRHLIRAAMEQSTQGYEWSASLSRRFAFGYMSFKLN